MHRLLAMCWTAWTPNADSCKFQILNSEQLHHAAISSGGPFPFLPGKKPWAHHACQQPDSDDFRITASVQRLVKGTYVTIE